MHLPRWLSARRIFGFLALQFVGSTVLSAISWGVGLVFGFVLTPLIDVPWFLTPILFLGFVLITAGLTALVLHRFVPSSWLEHEETQRAEASETTTAAWESTLDPTNRQAMVLSLRSTTGPQMIRGLACDVRGPWGGVPARAIINKQGPSQYEHVHYPENFVPLGAVPMDGRYEVTWYEADESWEWRRLVRSTHDITLPPPPPNVHINIQKQYDTTALISVGVENPRREAIASVSLDFVVPDFATELTPADQNSGRIPMPGSLMTTSERLTDPEGNEHGEGSIYWNQSDIKFSRRTHTVMYFRVTLAEALRPFPVKLVLVSQDLDNPMVLVEMIRPQVPQR